MRKTVDEKLQSTLEVPLGESFSRVVEQLERVHKGIGEMQSLAAGVGDLKKQVLPKLLLLRRRAIFCELPLTRDKDAEISAGAMAATCRRQA
jgi:DNA recombination protein RmuC